MPISPCTALLSSRPTIRSSSLLVVTGATTRERFRPGGRKTKKNYDEGFGVTIRKRLPVTLVRHTPLNYINRFAVLRNDRPKGVHEMASLQGTAVLYLLYFLSILTIYYSLDKLPPEYIR